MIGPERGLENRPGCPIHVLHPFTTVGQAYLMILSPGTRHYQYYGLSSQLWLLVRLTLNWFPREGQVCGVDAAQQMENKNGFSKISESNAASPETVFLCLTERVPAYLQIESRTLSFSALQDFSLYQILLDCQFFFFLLFSSFAPCFVVMTANGVKKERFKRCTIYTLCYQE